MTNHRLSLVVICIAAAVILIIVAGNAARFHKLISSFPQHEHEVSFAEGRRRRLQSLVNADQTTRNSADSGTNNVDHNPVLVLGLPRSGSLAVHNFFSCNGIRSSHYCCRRSSENQAFPGDNNDDYHSPISFPCAGSDNNDDSLTKCGSCVHRNMGSNQKPFQDCGDYQVYSQFDVETGDPFSWFLPQHFALPLLHEAYPDSTWILNRRGSSKQWATNVLHWYSVTNRLFQSFGIDYYYDAAEQKPPGTANHPPLTQGALVKEIQRSFARMHNETDHARRLQSLQDVYEQHLDKVRAYAAQATSHALIEIDVDDPASARNTLAQAFPGTRAECFQFDAAILDNDWRDFSLKL